MESEKRLHIQGWDRRRGSWGEDYSPIAWCKFVGHVGNFANVDGDFLYFLICDECLEIIKNTHVIDVNPGTYGVIPPKQRFWEDAGMNCPHCSNNFVIGKYPYGINHNQLYPGRDALGISWFTESVSCPGCKELIVWLVGIKNYEPPSPYRPGSPTSDNNEVQREIERRLVLPRSVSRGPVPSEVPLEFAEDYREACLILVDSPKASAALSRRCLQAILREKTEVPHKDLYGEIRWVIENANLPSEITEILDVPRRIGNVATHPMMTLSTGVIADVEPWEAEWCLEVIESLYDHYFVTPARNRERLQRMGQNQRP